MAKITQDQREIYQQKVKLYKNKIEELGKEVKKLNLEFVRDSRLEPGNRFKIAGLILNSVSMYCVMNEISVFLMQVKNTAFLEKARQQLYESIINIEKVVSTLCDAPYSEYSERTAKLAEISDKAKLGYIKKLGYCIDLVKTNFGENTKWKWSFVEIGARFSVISKNMLDLKRFQKLDDPRQEGFQERRRHLFFMQKLLQEASDGYREKFELSTKDIEDLKKAIDFQKALMRLAQLTGDNARVENCKKQVDVWNTLLEKHEKQVDEQKKKRSGR
jgi:hypothetical protein